MQKGGNEVLVEHCKNKRQTGGPEDGASGDVSKKSGVIKHIHRVCFITHILEPNGSEISVAECVTNMVYR